jgi:hypothetical protein
MIDGWRAEMLARGIDVNTIKARGPAHISTRRIHRGVSVAVAANRRRPVPGGHAFPRHPDRADYIAALQHHDLNALFLCQWD